MPESSPPPAVTASTSLTAPGSQIHLQEEKKSLVEAVEEEFDDYEALPENASLTASLVAGAFAGIMEHTVMYPVDAIKTRMQVAKTANIYSGIVNAVTKISSTEGAASLWRGIGSVIVGAGPAHAVYFGVYEIVKNRLGGNADHHHHPIVTSIAGASATTTSDALMNPFDVIKQRMQLYGKHYKTFTRCAIDVYRKEGLSAFYVSYPTTLIMNVPFTAVNFTVYESTSKILNPKKRHDPLVHCVAGGIAGASAAAITTPLDVIKTLLQTRGYDASTSNVNSFYTGAKHIYNTAGMKGFWRGLRPRIVSNMPSTAICWTSYEIGKFYINKSQQQNQKSTF
ncbi:hypothetical protein TRICI_004750 [Trichomonascus ciferrii]|uniref:Mitochondrial thiamine pyrophosphate carrier 1 n=1 Tax=Trichomonascus ciferrii TaxID=44093 RepID=A0A642V112_9ASCO|nr:hypothetical protein TRICI_004750 [Trichomonascus ciferrii]